MKPRSVPVLMYHHVSPEAGLVTVSPRVFAEQMAGLARAGYTSLTAEAFAGFLRGEAVPEKSVLITFDDGYLDNWVYAHPVLQRHGLHAVLFIATDWMGDGPPRPQDGSGEPLPDCPSHKHCKAAIREGRHDEVVLRWAEIEAMQTAGTFEFHSHTHTHTRWDQQCHSAEAKRTALRHDLQLSRQTLQQRLGSVSDHLCWPQGYYDADYLAEAQACGFHHLYTTEPGSNQQESLRIKRLVVKEKSARWLLSRLWLYRHPRLGNLYNRLSGR